MVRVAVALALVIAGCISAYFIATGIIAELEPYRFSNFMMIGIGLIVGLILFTLIEKHSAKITVPVILVIAVVCIVLGLL